MGGDRPGAALAATAVSVLSSREVRAKAPRWRRIGRETSQPSSTAPLAARHPGRASASTAELGTGENRRGPHASLATSKSLARLGACHFGFQLGVGPKLVLHLGEQEVFALVHRLRLEGQTLCGIVTELAARKVTSRGGRPLGLGSVRNLLRQPESNRPESLADEDPSLHPHRGPGSPASSHQGLPLRRSGAPAELARRPPRPWLARICVGTDPSRNRPARPRHGAKPRVPAWSAAWSPARRASGPCGMFGGRPGVVGPRRRAAALSTELPRRLSFFFQATPA